ncbi:RrF2 family transcriptional regulator [Parafilimonas terrae]|jgi:Rrf2 family protein|uniref:Transcriptional regulator, BadM/Rrf2 family n=1 Tax=Parafilimonas terrae TaxID=1465490 RepID=A0A1I5YWQ4_9BACT|nr:Rrf2 family transcriptional regulator [Parafilimonas terrae]SFQ48247.1 transcriptional regulator, BadM/Rrf2 family [Parafilimonas terrae]
MLSKKTKYAINALVYLARQSKDGEPVQISRIAESENIPRKFLEAILLELRHAGMLNSRKGKTGGYYLQKTPEEINIADVMRLFDGPIALLPCVAYKYYERCEECIDEETCGIRSVFSDVRAQTVKMLKGATLAEIVSRSEGLKKEISRRKKPPKKK